MSGFLPLLTASNGTAPKMAPEATSSQGGTEGAFGAVLAGLMGDASLDAAPAQGGQSFEKAMPGTPHIEHAGSALQRLKLALAEGAAQPGRPMVHTALASTVTMFSAAPAALELATAETDAAAAPALAPALADAGTTVIETPRTARPVSADAADAAGEEAPETAPETVAANDASVLAALAPTLPQQAAAPVAAPTSSFGFAVGEETPESADIDASAQPAKAKATSGFEQRDLPTARHDLSDRAEVRPLAATVTTLGTQPAQNSAQVQTQAQAPANASAEMANGADIAALAAIAPGAGQAATAGRTPAAGQPRRTAASEGEMLAGLTVDAPEQAAVPANAQSAASAQAAPAQEAKPASPEAAAPETAGTDKTVSFGEVSAAASTTGRERASDAENRPQAANAETAQPKADTAGSAQFARSAPAAEQAAAQPASQPAIQSASQSAVLPEGFQPVQAQPLHSQAGSPSALPHGSDVVRVASPQQLPEAVGVAISRHVGAEATEFTLRLDPAELGRIEVKMELGKDGQAVVSIQADNASTFDLLRRDSTALERALAEAGLKLDSGGLNFSLRQQDGQNQQQFANEGNQRQSTGRMQEAGLAALEQDNTPRPSRRSSAAGLLDLSI